ncbi:1-phosphofructokinase [Solimonas marina]|uniref:Phosphofructokinase n=1 Tax=Solimonas marina TaxID=2714601 RepID=A0A969WC41_9GAMM|nr:1-phosphofructokinase [Solimonas marina]NKF22125.1 1-phosphofructokinase [Solimonas marina]
MNAAVATVTLNPALDQTITLDRLRPGSVHRARAVRVNAGGKGINVAACLADWGVATAALGALGRDNAASFDALFAARDIVDRCIRLPGDTRTNVKLVEQETGWTTDINLPGLTLGGVEFDMISAQLADVLRPGMPVVLAGSLPPGIADDAWARLQAQASAVGARVVLDTSGAPLAAALAAPRHARPYAIKPNRHELEAWAGHALPDRAALLGAARGLLARDIGLVAISMGADGALFVRGDDALLARPPRIADGSSVGAGDAMVAGLTSALLDELDLEALARRAVAFAVAKLGCEGARLPQPNVVHEYAAATVIERLA